MAVAVAVAVLVEQEAVVGKGRAEAAKVMAAAAVGRGGRTTRCAGSASDAASAAYGRSVSGVGAKRKLSRQPNCALAGARPRAAAASECCSSSACVKPRLLCRPDACREGVSRRAGARALVRG